MPSAFGKYLWNTGPNPTYKFGDQWVVSDRLLLDLQYAHVGNNFMLGFQRPDLRDVQPTLIISTGLNGRSAHEERVHPAGQQHEPQRELLRARHARRRSRAQVRRLLRDNSNATSISHTGGFATVRFPTAITNDCLAISRDRTRGWCQVDLIRDGFSVYDLTELCRLRAGHVHARPR